MNVTSGKNTTFKVLTTFGSDDLKFQWLYNKTIVISEGMSSVLTVMSVTKMNEGSYSCIVSFPFGENITSKEAQLFVCEHCYDGIILFTLIALSFFFYSNSFTSLYQQTSI